MSSLAVRVRSEHRVELGKKPRVVAGGQVRVDARLDRLEP